MKNHGMKRNFLRPEWLWSTVAVVLGVLASGVVANAEELPPYHHDTTDCENTYFIVPTTADRVRSRVPEPLRVLLDEAGLGSVGVMFTSCDMVLNGESLGRVNWSDVGVLIEPPASVFEEEPKIHVYRTWSVADAEALVDLNMAWGIDTERTGVHTVYGRGLPLATSAGLVETTFGDYAGQGQWVGVVHPAVEGTVVWWNLSDRGVVRFDQAYREDKEQCGAGSLTAEGRLGAMIGPSAYAPHGCITFPNLVGTATLVGSNE